MSIFTKIQRTPVFGHNDNLVTRNRVDSADTYPKNYPKIIASFDGRTFTLPIILLLSYITLTYFPKIYSILPFLGTIKSVFLIGILLLISYIRTRREYHNLTAYKHPILIAWFCFMFFMLLGLISSMDRGKTLSHVEKYYKHFLMFLIMIKIFDTPKRLNLIMGVFAACGVGMALTSLMFGEVIGIYRVIAIKGGILGDPNDLAFFLNCTLPVLLFFYTKSVKRWVIIACTVIVLVAIVRTHSRGGFIGMCCIGAGYAFFFTKVNKRFVLLIIALAIVLWLSVPETYKKRMGTIFEFHETQYGKTGTRADTWIPNLKAGLKHPITGLGMGMTVYVNGMLFSDWHATHNSFVQVFTETGLIGFFFYILLFIIPFKQYRQMIKRNSTLTGDDLLRMKAIMIAFIAYSSTGFFLPQAYSPILFLLTGFFLIQRELITKRAVISMQETGYRRRSDRIMQKNKQVEPLVKSRYFA